MFWGEWEAHEPHPAEFDAAAIEQRRYGVSFRQLVEAGLIAPGSSLTGTRAGHQVDASVTAEGRIRLDGGGERGGVPGEDSADFPGSPA